MHAEPAHGEDDAKEEQQRVPFNPLDLLERVQHHVVVPKPRALALQEVGPDLQVAQAQHHAQRGRQMQEVPEGNGRGDGKREEDNHAFGTWLGANGFRCGLQALSWECQMHEGRHQPVDQRRHEQREEFKNVSLSFCQTIRVVMSPKGENAPPAFAATTMLMKPMATNFGESLPIARTTAPMTKAVVRLSRTPDRKNANVPVSQNRLR